VRTIIAKHENGICLNKDSYPEVKNRLNVSIPGYLFNYSEEHLENGRNLVICTCPFFDDYLGIGNSKWNANVQTRETLESVFTKLIEADTFFAYLEDKNFKVIKSTLNSFKPFTVTCFLDSLRPDPSKG
jgi:hypothetical protein